MNAGNCGRTIRWSFLALALLGLLAPGARLHAAAAVPGVIPGLEPEAAQKLDPLLWMALAAERAAAARGEAPAQALAIMAIGAENGAAGPTVDLLIQVQDDLAGMRPALAVPITAMIGRIATATAVPIARVADLARDPPVARLAPARRYLPMDARGLDRVRHQGERGDRRHHRHRHRSRASRFRASQRQHPHSVPARPEPAGKRSVRRHPVQRGRYQRRTGRS